MAPCYKDITGQKIGKWKAIKHIGSDKNRNAVWECVSDSGEIRYISANSLRSYVRGPKKDTDPLSIIKVADRAGQKFGRLTAVKPAGRYNGSRMVQWECRCDCGNIVTVCGGALQSGGTTSCGCSRKSIKRDPKTYYLGVLCKRGHEYKNTGRSQRYKTNGCCTICTRLRVEKATKKKKEIA